MLPQRLALPARHTACIPEPSLGSELPSSTFRLLAVVAVAVAVELTSLPLKQAPKYMALVAVVVALAVMVALVALVA